MSTKVMTKAEYQEAIDDTVIRRREALQKITELTREEFNETSILHYAYSALRALDDMRLLKQQMRDQFPTQCTCTCIEHNQEA